jgi:hypothetical protein
LTPISHLPVLTYFSSHNLHQTPTLPTHSSIPLLSFVTMSLDHFASSGSVAMNITASDSPPSATPLASLSGSTSPSQVLHSHHRA